MPVVYVVSCDCQMFQVNFIPSLNTFWRRNVLYLTKKLPFGYLLYVQNDLSFLILSRRSMDRHVVHTKPQLYSISCSSPLNLCWVQCLSASFSTNDSHNLKKCCLMVFILISSWTFHLHFVMICGKISEHSWQKNIRGLLRLQYICHGKSLKTWRQSFTLIVIVKCCGRFIYRGKSVLYFKSSKKVKN